MRIQGEVTPYHDAVVTVVVRGRDGDRIEVPAVVDTGFTGHLSLSQELIDSLSLTFEGWTEVELADGEGARLPVYSADAEWIGAIRGIPVLSSGGACLLGMAMMYGHELRIQVLDGGAVTIEPIQ
jgi:clan AA aspartic protease